jgi:hypothetical protein
MTPAAAVLTACCKLVSILKMEATYSCLRITWSHTPEILIDIQASCFLAY